MKVWIDQDLCTGDGLCEEIAPDVFVGLDDGLFYVKEGEKIFSEENGNVGGAEGLANVPKGQEEAVVESAEECPGECIMRNRRKVGYPIHIIIDVIIFKKFPRFRNISNNSIYLR